MPRIKRSIVAPDGESVTLHCYNRCIRRKYLCGKDNESGKDYRHRKQWILNRLELLASVFAIDILSFALMDNHFHLVCRTRPDISDTWDDMEVARRIFKLSPGSLQANGESREPTPIELEEVLQQGTERNPQQRAQVLRTRLQSISWFMKTLCEYIAKRANREEQITGKFWEDRFRVQKLLDEEAILACNMYVELNPVRAAQVTCPEDTPFSSVYHRTQLKPSSQRKPKHKGKRVQRLSTRRICFLAPLSLPTRFPKDSHGREDRIMPCKQGHRASNKGFLKMTLNKYLLLLDWTGRQIRSDKRGTIPSRVNSILQRLRISPDSWLKCVEDFGIQFGWAVGRKPSLDRERLIVGRLSSRGLCFTQAHPA